MRTSSYFTRLSGKLFSLAGLSALFIAAWGLNKGFDLSDEGFSMLGFTQKNDPNPFLYFQLICRQLFGWAEPGLLFYRILRLILTLSASYFFARKFNSWIQSVSHFSLRPVDRSAITFLLLAGSMMSYSIFPSSLGYNSLTLIIFLYLGGHCLQILTRIHEGKHRSISRSAFLIGALCGLEFFAKFHTSAIFLLMASGLVIFNLILHRQFTRIPKLILAGIIGICLPFVLVFAGSIGPAKFFADLQNALHSIQGHGTEELKHLYRQSIEWTWKRSVKSFWYVPLISFVLGLASSLLGKKISDRKVPYLVAILSLLLLIPYLQYCRREHLYQSGMIYLYRAMEPFLMGICAYIAYLAGTAILSLNKFSFDPRKIERWAVIFFLLFAPIGCAVGTGNEIVLQCLQYMVFWFAFLILLLPKENDANKPVTDLWFLFILFFSVSQIYYGSVIHPYRLTQNLHQQSLSADRFKGLKGVKIDKNTYDFLSRFESTMKKIKVGKDQLFIDLCKSAGAVYITQGHIPKCGWMTPATTRANCYYINSSNLPVQDPVFLLPGNYEVDSLFVDCLNQKGVDFPTSYQIVDSIPHYLYNYPELAQPYQIMIWQKKK